MKKKRLLMRLVEVTAAWRTLRLKLVKVDTCVTKLCVSPFFQWVHCELYNFCTSRHDLLRGYGRRPRRERFGPRACTSGTHSGANVAPNAFWLERINAPTQP